jgi:hypothetical protein
MARSINEPEVIWNVVSENPPEKHNWYLVFINRPDRTIPMWDKFAEGATQIEDNMTIRRENINGTRYEYHFITCQSSKAGPHNLKLKDIYKCKVSRNKQLYDRNSKDGLGEFVDRMFSE